MRRGRGRGQVLIVIVSGAKVGRGAKRFCRESDAGDNLGGDCGIAHICHNRHNQQWCTFF